MQVCQTQVKTDKTQAFQEAEESRKIVTEKACTLCPLEFLLAVGKWVGGCKAAVVTQCRFFPFLLLLLFRLSGLEI